MCKFAVLPIYTMMNMLNPPNEEEGTDTAGENVVSIIFTRNTLKCVFYNQAIMCFVTTKV